jgi:hypothetical protein
MSRRTAKVLQIDPEARPAPARYGSPGRATLLPWENTAEFEALLAELMDEHQPEGPTERHLVEELAAVMWRCRRVGLAEAAIYRAGLHEAVSAYRTTRTVQRALAYVGDEGTEGAEAAVQATVETSAADLADMDQDQARTEEALRRLQGGGGEGAYAHALEALRDDTRSWWARVLEEDERDLDDLPWTADADSLRRFLQDEVMLQHQQRRREIGNRPLIAAQAQGEALDPVRLTTLSRYEAHLDRKLEKTLAMLLRLKQLRGAS